LSGCGESDWSDRPPPSGVRHGTTRKELACVMSEVSDGSPRCPTRVCLGCPTRVCPGCPTRVCPARFSEVTDAQLSEVTDARLYEITDARLFEVTDPSPPPG